MLFILITEHGGPWSFIPIMRSSILLLGSLPWQGKNWLLMAQLSSSLGITLDQRELPPPISCPSHGRDSSAHGHSILIKEEFKHPVFGLSWDHPEALSSPRAPQGTGCVGLLSPHKKHNSVA